MRGEVDARATAADSIAQRNPDWLGGGLVDFHTILEIPKGDKHPQFKQLPELESFARSDRERKVIILSRAFRVAGGPSVLPPGTPKDRVAVVKEAFRKTYKDPEFLREYKKLKKDLNSKFNPYNGNGDDEKLLEQLKGIKRTTGQHPGGLLVIPQKVDIHNYTPLNFPADNKNAE